MPIRAPTCADSAGLALQFLESGVDPPPKKKKKTKQNND